MSFNEKLQQLRKENKLSQEKLADMLDVTRQSVSKWESGTTYPEMDKLITMCKIFKCSLDDLTNDEITEISTEKKNDSLISGLIKNISEIIESSVRMFRSMNFFHICGTLLALLILAGLLMIIRVPFVYLEEGFYQIVSNIQNHQVVGFISCSFNFILDILFFALYILAFVYIYKVAYLDRYEFVKEEKIKEVKEDFKEEISEEREIKIVDKERVHNDTLFRVLGNIVIFFIRLIVGIFSIPFIFTLVALCALLVIIVYLLFSKIVFIGATLGVLFLIVMNVWVLETFSIFVFNRKSSFKRLLWTFIICLAGLGISGGIFALELSDVEFINEAPSEIASITYDAEYKMTDDFALCDYGYYHKHLSFEIDETLKDKVVFEITHYSEATDVVFRESGGALSIDVYQNSDFMNIKELIEHVKGSLRNKKFYDYGKLYDVDIVIKTSQSNIELIKSNTNAYIESERQKVLEEAAKYNNEAYEDLIGQLEETIDEYERRLDEMNSENDNLKERILELESYVERVKDIVSE